MRIAQFFAAALAATCATWAAAEPASKPGRFQPLSRSELRSCMDRAAELDKRGAALNAAKSEHNASLAVLTQEALVLANELRNLDTNDEAAVESYNKRTDERNRKVEILNRHAQSFTAVSEDFKIAVADHMAECVSRPFLKADEEALLREGVKGRKPIGRDSVAPVRSNTSLRDT